MKRPFMRKPVYVILFLFLSLLVAELFLRILGYKPYDFEVWNVKFEPAFNYSPDPILGYSLVDGDFTVTSIANKDTLTFHATHQNKQRITGCANTLQDSLKHIVLLGCSFTYGQGLEDTSTHPYMLQQKLWQNGSKRVVENWGVGGYGPAQFYFNSEKLDSSKVALVIVNYASFQNERTTLARSWRKRFVPNQKNIGQLSTVNMPCFTISNGFLLLKRKKMTYDYLPFQRQLVFIELLDRIYCRIEQRYATKVSQLVLGQTLKRIKTKGIDVLLCGITDDETTRRVVGRFKKEGYKTMFYNVDVWNPKYNLLPKDNHPNYVANLIFSDSLYACLKRYKYF